MTLCVPSSAASSKGTGAGCHGVLTMRTSPSSVPPIASGTMYPTQSTSFTRRPTPSSSTATPSSGMNFGSVVMTVLPPADCGSSSRARSRTNSLLMFGITSDSMKRLIKVDLPVRTGPTTPM